MMNKAYSYRRFSTPEQMKGDSLRRQTEAAERYAALHGLVIDTELRFDDLGVSAFRGRNAEAGALGDFLTAVRQGLVEPGSTLIVESLDRVSRLVPRKALRVLEDILEEGITVVTLSDGRAYTREALDGDTTSLLIALLTFIRANEESAMKAQRVRASWQGKRGAAHSKPLTSIVPAWMRRDGDQIILIPERAEVVRRIVDMALGGVGQNLIAQTLNREEVPVFGNGRHWHRSYIKKIIENPALNGTLVPHEVFHEAGKRVRRPLTPVTGYYPTLVTEEEWSRLAGLAAGRKPQVKQNAGLKNVLAGLAVCVRCGGSMIRVQKGPRTKPVLVCSTAKAGAGCVYKSIPMTFIDMHVRGGLPDIALSYPSGDDNVDHLAEQIRELETHLDVVLHEMLEHGRSPALSSTRTDIEARLESARRELRDAIDSSKARSLANPEALFALQGATNEELNLALRSLFKEVRIKVESSSMAVWEYIPI